MLRVKGQDGFCPIGPELTPAADFDPTDFRLRTFLNGAVVQEARSDDLIWPIAYLLADLCRLITLEPGDVILTGTPANSRPMEPGDTVAVEVSGLGRLENHVVDWDVDLSGPGEQPQVSAQTLHVATAMPEDEAERAVAAGEAAMTVAARTGQQYLDGLRGDGRELWLTASRSPTRSTTTSCAARRCRLRACTTSSTSTPPRCSHRRPTTAGS